MSREKYRVSKNWPKNGYGGDRRVTASLGLGVAFNSAVRNIAEAEGIPAKEVLGRLWTSTKNFLKQKFIPLEKIGEPEIEVLMQEAEEGRG